ncbi:uncharacterized protein row [Drosophila kikkawai]|uniref:Uncharacterized protein row n=1 Tax=Drosophila kikkawai TaxID=30033 RepID=A0A6P4IBC1_DROKI|nr:uncharacterized protein LOC108073119 [Drosophila kikkawai]KAH8309158.1 hypothetical protein KR059_006419 [Drosophila kikkawai]
MTRVTRSEISLDMEIWVEELSPAQLAYYEKITNEHNAVKGALKNAVSANEGKELFNGQVFQAYSFKGKVLQDLKEATLPKKPPKAADPPPAPSTPASGTGRGRGRPPRSSPASNNNNNSSNIAYLESSDEGDDDVPLAKRLALSAGKKAVAAGNASSASSPKLGKRASASSPSGKASPQLKESKKSSFSSGKSSKESKMEGGESPPKNYRPAEVNSVGGLVVGSSDESKDSKDGKETKDNKMQGKTYPSLVVLAKPFLKIKDMAATRSKLDSKVKLVLMLTPNKFCEWLLQEGLLRAQQHCINHRNNELKLGIYSDVTKFPYTGGYVWISECCPYRFVSVFNNSIFEGAQHPPTFLLKLIYHWACQTSIQNVVQWVKVDSVYIKGIYTWLRAICTLAVHQKCKKLGGPGKFVEVGVISLGTTSQDGSQRQVKVEVLGVYDYAEKSIRLRAVEPITDGDRNYKKRFQAILEPLSRWVHKDSTICIDLTVDKITLFSMGFKNIVQAAATDNTAKHNNSAVMEYLRRIVPRMFQNTLSLLSRQMIQQFLDELVWREAFGTYALQAFNNIIIHIAEQTRVTTNETITQRLYQVATNPFKDWSVLPANYKETPANAAPKRLKKPINDADYNISSKVPKKEKDREKDILPSGVKRGRPPGSLNSTPTGVPPVKKGPGRPPGSTNQPKADKATTSKPYGPASSKAALAAAKITPKKFKEKDEKVPVVIKKEEDELKGLEELYYGISDGTDEYYEMFPYNTPRTAHDNLPKVVECPICLNGDSFDSNEKLQTHLVSHISPEGKQHQFQCLFCLEKHPTESVLAKHNQIMHPTETKTEGSPSYYCLICQQRHNSLHLLTAHLQKAHSTLELPYWCHSCGYRSSSHRDVVRHYYDDHKNHNFLQCPYCLDIFYFSKRGAINSLRIEHYFMHLDEHINKKDSSLRCQKCSLSFLEKGDLKQHVVQHHVSMTKTNKPVRLLLNNSLLIPPPKVRTHHREQPPFSTYKRPVFFAFLEGKTCAECNTDYASEETHYTGWLHCVKCNYQTCCERAQFRHGVDCNGNFVDAMEVNMPQEMHCICGFATGNGNKMAQHLANCGLSTCYPSLEAASENAVKRNMLDMLGLVRRDGDTSGEGADLSETVDSADQNSDILPPSDQDQQLQQVSEHHVQDQQMHEQPRVEPQSELQPEYLSAPVDEPVQSLPVHQGLPVHQQPGPIQFGEMEAAPVILDPQQQQQQQQVQSTPDYAHVSVVQQHQQQQQQPYGLSSYGQSTLATDIDMPLIGELSEPNAPPTPQFLGEVHTPMFDAVAAAEQQHYHAQHQHHHHPQ